VCCICQGSCSHTGPHAYCWRHQGEPLTPTTSSSELTTFYGLSDADVDRIARRMLQLLKESGLLGIHHAPIEELDEELRYE
jgi:hypothetical protein